MLNIVLFIISFLFVISSSYLITSILRPKKIENTILYFILIAISQVIISIESLSLLKQINISGLLIINFIIFTTGFLFRLKKSSGYADISIFKVIKDAKIFQSLKQDKILLILFLFFCFSSLISFFFTLTTPTTSSDSLAYHLARIGFWLQNNSLAHFETSSIRQIVFPINSEIMILWPMIFLKRDYLAIMNEYLAYWGCLFVVFSFLKYLKFSTKRILWAIFILASLPAVILESSSAQTNLIMGFLLFCSLYLFVFGTREKDKTAVIFSAISYAIALGTKNTAFFFIPVFGIIYLIISVKESGRAFYKPLLIFMSAIIPAFIILSSYNYILNFIDFGNPFGPVSFIYKHSGSFGIKSFITNMIKYFFLFFDFTGIREGKYLSPILMNIKDGIFHFWGLKTTDGLAFKDLNRVNLVFHENYSTFGILGFLLILPLIFKSVFNKINFFNNKRFYIGLTALVTIIFLFSISSLMGFSFWNNRYLITAIVLSSPVIIFSYSRKINFLKIIISLIAVYYYFFTPLINLSKPFFEVLNVMLNSNSFSDFREDARLRYDNRYFKGRTSFFALIKYLKKTVPDNSRIGLIFSEYAYYYPFFEANSTWKIYQISYDRLVATKNFNDYDFIIFANDRQYIDFNRKKAVYNYVVKDKIIFYKPEKADIPTILYMDKDQNYINSGLPAFMCNIFDFDRIPKNFKLIKIILPESSKAPIHEFDFNFYVYRKL